MAVADITVWLILLAFFNYFIIYRKNAFMGSIGYFLLGLLMFGVRTEFSYSQEMYGFIAMFIMFGALANMLYEVLFMLNKRKRKGMT